MATKKLVGGYQWNQHIARGKSANRHARAIAKRILDEQPNPGMAALYIAQIAVDLGIADEVLDDLAEIAGKSTTPEPCG